jgi:hypothetical protein
MRLLKRQKAKGSGQTCSNIVQAIEITSYLPFAWINFKENIMNFSRQPIKPVTARDARNTQSARGVKS